LSQGDTPFKLIVGSMVLITLGCSTTKTVPLTQAITLNPSFTGAYYNRAVGYFAEKKCAQSSGPGLSEDTAGISRWPEEGVSRRLKSVRHTSGCHTPALPGVIIRESGRWLSRLFPFYLIPRRNGNGETIPSLSFKKITLIMSDFGEAAFFARFLFWVATERFATC